MSYAIVAGFLFWFKKGFYVLLPLSAFLIGAYVFFGLPYIFSLQAKLIILVSAASLELVFFKFSIKNNDSHFSLPRLFPKK